MTAALATLVLLAACDGDEGTPTAAAGEPALDTRAVVMADLREDLEAVAAAQRGADAPVSAALQDLRAADELVADVRTTATFDAALARHAQVLDAVAAIDLAAARVDLRALAPLVDRARASVARAEGFDGPELAARLDAEDALLLAVRDLAEADDALAQVVEQQLPAYAAVGAVVREQAAIQDRYRTPEEALGAMEVALGPVLRGLGDAQQLVARFRSQREVAAQALTSASEAAAAARVAASDEEGDDA